MYSPHHKSPLYKCFIQSILGSVISLSIFQIITYFSIFKRLFSILYLYRLLKYIITLYILFTIFIFVNTKYLYIAIQLILLILDNKKFHLVSRLFSGLITTCSRLRKPKVEPHKHCVFFIIVSILLYFQFEAEIVFHITYLSYPEVFLSYFYRTPLGFIYDSSYDYLSSICILLQLTT